MASALIVDDEPLLREQLRGRLATLWPDLDRVDEAGDGFEAMALIEGDAGIPPPSVCFLDIHMPGPSGLDVAHRIQAMRRAGDAAPPEVVFITAYDAHAIEAFEHGAVDYLLKPFEPERLAETITRLKQRLASPSQHMGSRGSPDALMQLAQRLAGIGSTPRPTLQWIKAGIGSTVRLIPVEDVLYFHADDKYTSVVTIDGEALIRKPIKELVTELDGSRFWQIHRATIVNTHAIAGVVRGLKDSADLRLKNRPETLTVSRAYLHLFRQM
jgi:DNA-binding LytR/AlgR family response regulator